MMKKREELDLSVIVDDSINRYLTDRKLTGATPFDEMSEEEKARMRQAFLPAIWNALPSILEQVDAKPVTAEETPEEILADFTVPDSLEGLIL